MVTIGNTKLPGVQTTVKSSGSTGVNVGAPGDVGLVGPADLIDGVASENEVKRITSAPSASTEFGRGSELSVNIADALAEGAYPVYAAAPEYDSGNETYDYESAIDALVEEEGDTLDFIGVLTADEIVATQLHTAVKDMESNGNLAIAIAGADVDPENVTAYSRAFDSSRMQTIYPATNDDGESIIGSYLGLRARLGMNASPMKKRLQTQRKLSISLSRDEMEHLADERVNPVKSERSGALIMDDMTTVADDNLDEWEFRQGISRIVTDYVTVIVNDNSDRFIGELHTQAARNSLAGIIKSELKDLLELNAIVGYSVEVEPIDAMEARVNTGIETVKPLRNIRAVVTAGEVE